MGFASFCAVPGPDPGSLFQHRIPVPSDEQLISLRRAAGTIGYFHMP